MYDVVILFELSSSLGHCNLLGRCTLRGDNLLHSIVELKTIFVLPSLSFIHLQWLDAGMCAYVNGFWENNFCLLEN